MTKERDRLVERAARAMCDKLAVVNGDDCWDIASPRMREDFLVGARAAIAEIEKDHVRVWTCENCAFSFDAIHTNADGSYSCPVCEVTKLEAEAAAKKLGAAPPPDAGQRVLDVVEAAKDVDRIVGQGGQDSAAFNGAIIALRAKVAVLKETP